MNPFERIHSGEPSIFATDQTFRTVEFGAWLAASRTSAPPWPAFRDSRLATKQARERKPLAGHANEPLNLPGSRSIKIKRSK